jgi:putative ABC transport system ATP-binding protein
MDKEDLRMRQATQILHTHKTLISISHLFKTYIMGEVTVHALNDVSLDVAANQVTVILGASGCGKTTMLNMIGGIDSPTRGEIVVDGVKIHRLDQRMLGRYRQEKIGFIFQFFNLIPNLTARENIEFVLEYVMEQPVLNKIELAQKLLEKVGLGHRGNHFPYQLSGGEQQRVSIARALAKEPKILLADEPTGELDYRTGLQILELLSSFARNGRAVLIVTHNREISKIAHRVIYLRDGKILRIEQNKTPMKASQLAW